MSWTTTSHGMVNGFRIGGIEIAFYAICILTGVIIAVIMGVKEAKRLGISADVIYTGVVITLPLAIIGARLWYVLFNISSFSSFGEVLGFRNGKFEGLSGLAIQGGIIVTLITVYIYCKKRNVSFYKIMDVVAPGLFIGQICGRWGNFFNQELYGPAISAQWYSTFINAVLGGYMKIGSVTYHPTFLYESLLNLCGLIVILVFRYKKNKIVHIGDMAGFYLFWYGCVRIFTETLRLNSGVAEPLMWGPIPVSIAISVIFIVLGAAFLVCKRLLADKKLIKGVVLFPEEVLYHTELERVKEAKPDTLLFDLDGTLLNTRDLIYKSFIHTFAHFYPEKVLTDEELESFFGPTLYQSFSRYSEDEKQINEMIEYYREFNVANHDEMVTVFKGVKNTINVLHDAGYNLGVVSSKKSDLVKHGLDLFDLLDCFDVVIGADEVNTPKPAPDGILAAIDKLKKNVEKKKGQLAALENTTSKFSFWYQKTFKMKYKEVKDIYYIGDTENDIIAGKAAGVKTIGVLYIPHPEVMLKAQPDNVISKFNELLNICGE